MTIKTISESDALAAWMSASSYLLNHIGTEDSNVVVEIDNPVIFNSSWLRIDPREIHTKGENPSNVANTIFPEKTWRNSSDRNDLYARYKRGHRRSRNKKWGTYFLRLIDFGISRTNQLERAIEVLNTWEKEPGTAITFHLSSPEIDRPRPLGAPCLQLCQLYVCNGRIDMAAIYRNHDYFNKAFPNFIGLGRLLNFICAQTNRSPGRLVCHSGHAYSSYGRGALEKLKQLA